MPILRFSEKNAHETIKKGAREDIEDSKNKPQAEAEIDLNRCGDLYFQTPDGEILTAPNEPNDTKNGENRLKWLIKQIRDYHKGPEEEKEAIIKHITQYAHQEGFLFAGRNGVAKMMNSKNMIFLGQPHYVSSSFSLRNGQFSYIERYDLPKGFASSDEVFSSDVSLATLIMRSVMTFDPENKDKQITQKIESLDITIKDELALNIFADRKDPTSKILEKEKNLKEFTKPGFFRRLIESISSLFQRNDEKSPNKPKP